MCVCVCEGGVGEGERRQFYERNQHESARQRECVVEKYEEELLLVLNDGDMFKDEECFGGLHRIQ